MALASATTKGENPFSLYRVGLGLALIHGQPSLPGIDGAARRPRDQNEARLRGRERPVRCGHLEGKLLPGTPLDGDLI